MMKNLRFTLRAKVLAIFMSCVFLVVGITTVLYDYASRHTLIDKELADTESYAKLVNQQIQASQDSEAYVDQLLGNELKIASIAIEQQLPHDAQQVTNQQLKNLSKKLGIADITLLQPNQAGTDIVGVKSSDPHEIGMSTKSWGSWYTAFQQLWKYHKVTIDFGVGSSNYWAGPWSDEQYNPKVYDKWGYYYDGTTNYIIDPYVTSDYIQSFSNLTGPSAITKNIMAQNHSILNVVGFNPQTFKQKASNFLGAKRLTYAENNDWASVHNHPIAFGTYKYVDNSRDLNAIEDVYHKGKSTHFIETVNHQKVIKTFIPIHVAGSGTFAKDSEYVVEFVTDYGVIQSVLNVQIRNGILISLIMLLLTGVISVLVSAYIVRPLVRITRQVEQLADHQFYENIIERNDEIGDLARTVNTMSQSLRQYSEQMLQQVSRERSFGMSFLGMVASGLIHELRSPISVIHNLLRVFPRVQPLQPKGEEMVGHMRTASKHVNTIVDDFSDFITNGKLSIDYLDGRELVGNAVSLIKTLTHDKDVEIVVEDCTERDTTVRVDGDKVTQILVNLLKNGIDALSDVGPRKVAIRMSHDNGMFVVDVIDTGHGIPKEEWDHLFVPFKSSKGSFGIGLAWSKYIALACGGTLDVIESAASGTTMRIALPMWQSRGKQ
ncbi:sensor histidine kinase [Alicyclobacillus fastidiosus]|uniref:histidine kinase n=1 Tax=Alicyclobacillus fastidiosus TaxID=392011 RepID=A0ABV5AA72_9BACL|nr:HAMP domain-containing sensor histidine kinase [Alicyclobacillus fastidiosus]WEH07690.1 HAMP domain-containing sensor histidine kinase [Alicyclobacillus fastidiosus]